MEDRELFKLVVVLGENFLRQFLVAAVGDYIEASEEEIPEVGDVRVARRLTPAVDFELFGLCEADVVDRDVAMGNIL